MTLQTKDDWRQAQDQASWSAAYTLQNIAHSHSGGFEWTLLAKAMFHAGEAWAYHQCGDLVAKAHAKQAKASKAKPGAEPK